MPQYNSQRKQNYSVHCIALPREAYQEDLEATQRTDDQPNLQSPYASLTFSRAKKSEERRPEVVMAEGTFKKVFKMRKQTFLRLPVHKQKELKKRLGY